MQFFGEFSVDQAHRITNGRPPSRITGLVGIGHVARRYYAARPLHIARKNRHVETPRGEGGGKTVAHSQVAGKVFYFKNRLWKLVIATSEEALVAGTKGISIAVDYLLQHPGCLSVLLTRKVHLTEQRSGRPGGSLGFTGEFDPF